MFLHAKLFPRVTVLVSLFFGKHLDWMEYIRLYIATNGGEEGGEQALGRESLFSRACASTYNI